MILDDTLMLCDKKDIAGAIGSSVLSDVLNIGQVNNDLGALVNDRPNVSGRLILNVLAVDVAMAAAANGCVVTFNFYNDTDDAPTTGGDIILTKSITVNTAATPAGTQLVSVSIPLGQLKPYLGLKISIATQALASGHVSAWVGTPMQQGK